MTTLPTTRELHKKLSELAQTFSPEDPLLILDDFEEGLTTTLQALPLAEKFEVKVMERDGQIRKRQVPDELLLFSPEAEQWFNTKALGTRQLHLEQRGNVPVNPERILAGQDNFAALFEARRKFVVQKRAGKAKTPASRTPAPKQEHGKETATRTKTADEGGRKRGRTPAEQPQDERQTSTAQVASDA